MVRLAIYLPIDPADGTRIFILGKHDPRSEVGVKRAVWDAKRRQWVGAFSRAPYNHIQYWSYSDDYLDDLPPVFSTMAAIKTSRYNTETVY